MKPSAVSLEEVVAANAPRRYGFQEAIGSVLEQPPTWLASIRPHYDGDWDELLRTLKHRLPRDPFTQWGRTLRRTLDPMERANASLRLTLGLALLHVGQREGADIFLQSLRCSDPEVREQALAQLPGLSSWNWSGGLPLRPAEVAHAIEPVLLQPDDMHAASALAFCVFHAYASARDQLVRRRASRDPKVFQPILQAFMEADVDDGSFDVLARHLLEPGIHASKELVNRGRVVHDLCFVLLAWTADHKEPAHRERAAALAMQVLQQSLAKRDAPERLAHGADGWFYSEHLMEAAASARTEPARLTLRQLAQHGGLDLRVRAQALALHSEIGGPALPERSAIVIGLLLRDWSTMMLSDLLAKLVKQQLAGMRELAQAASQPGWTFAATEAMRKWPRSPADDGLAVRGLVEALGSFAHAYPERREQVGYLVAALRDLPRTEAQGEAIQVSLRQALAAAEAVGDEPWLAQEVRAFLAQFGAGGTLDLSTMGAWDAMHEHWRREGLGWEQVAQVLVDSGALDFVPSGDFPAADEAGLFALAGLLEAGGRGGLSSLRDIGYDHRHDRLFSDLAALARPRIALEAIAQMNDIEFTPVPLEEHPPEAIRLGLPVLTTEGTLQKVVFHHGGGAREFFAAPVGTLMDAWAVLHAFDLFMAQLGRPERAFWLAAPEDGDWALFACAPPEPFGAACERLRIPLRRKAQ